MTVAKRVNLTCTDCVISGIQACSTGVCFILFHHHFLFILPHVTGMVILELCSGVCFIYNTFCMS